MDPLQRGSSSHGLVPSHEDPSPVVPAAPARAEHERWLVRTAERTEAGATVEQSLSAALALGGPGSRVAFEAKALVGKGLKLGAAGKLEVEQQEHGYRVVMMGGLAAKAGKHGQGWKAELEPGLTTGRAWHFQTREAAAWAGSLLLQGLARGSPAALLLPGDPGLEERLRSLESRASVALLEGELGAKWEARMGPEGLAAEGLFTGAVKVEVDAESGELVVEQEVKVSGVVGLRAFQAGPVEVGPEADLATVRTQAAWVQRWKLMPSQREAAGRGDLLSLARSLSPDTAHRELKITLSGQVAGRGFEATAHESVRAPGEVATVLRPESLARLPVRFAEVVPAHGGGAELELGPLELAVEAKVEPKRGHPGELRPLGEWLGRLVEGTRGLDAARLQHTLSALMHGH